MSNPSLDEAKRCAGYVLKGIGIALAAVAVFTAALVATAYLAVITTAAIGLDARVGPAFFLLYLAVIAGGSIGAAICRESAT